MLNTKNEHRRVAAKVLDLFQSVRDLHIPDSQLVDAIIEQCIERSLIVDERVQSGLFSSQFERLIEAKFLLLSSGWLPTQLPMQAGFGVDDFDY